ncbi:MAG TPA: AsmA family protein [Rhizomicrobium sp.]|nr:AsmA family protein [Rhizomicrobium sp.]
MNRRLRTGLIGAAALALGASALGALASVLPADRYKAPIERDVGRATGRPFTIAGPIHFDLFPVPGFRAERVTLGGLATVDEMRIAVAIGPLLAGRIDVTGVALDGPRLSGNLSLDLHGKVPRVAGLLRFDRLDLNPAIRPHRAGGSPPKPSHRADDGWSKEPISLDLLNRLNASLVVDAGAVAVKSLKLGRTHMTVALKDGKLEARLAPMTLYGGTGTATLAIDARARKFRNRANFENVALAPFLTDTIGVRQIEGTGTIRLDVASQGAAPDAIMHRLSGRGAIDFRDGRLTGVDLGRVARTIQAMLGAVEGKGQFTDYSAMRGRFTLTNGVLTSEDFALDGPLLRTEGAGRVDIGGRAIDFKIVPRTSMFSIGVPFHIFGPWGHVRYKADLGSVKDALKHMLGIH